MRKIFPILLLFLILGCNLLAASTGGPPLPAATVQTPSTAGGTEQTVAAVTIPDIPESRIQADGAEYLAFQAEDSPYRFLCPEPCATDPELIRAQYAGFDGAHEILRAVVGIDPLPELQPVDFHLRNDPYCGNLSDSPALSYAGRIPDGTAQICTFLFEYIEGPGGRAYLPEDAVRLDQQVILVHEYLHTVFFGRVTQTAGAFHDFVTPLGLYIGLGWEGEVDLCEYHPETPPGDYGGYLIQELCARNGFRMEDLPRFLAALDALTQSGGGELDEGYLQPVPSMRQVRDLLDGILGSETREAFRYACWPATLFGEDYELPLSCTQRTPTLRPTPIP
jgi:hypothetical protein